MGELSANICTPRASSHSKRNPRVSSPKTAWKPSSSSFVFLESHATAVPLPSPTSHTLLLPLRVVVLLPAHNVAKGHVSASMAAPTHSLAYKLPRTLIF